jgi:membrane protease YdiL (CAAX protease family)
LPNLNHEERTFAGTLEALLEISATALAAGGLLNLFLTLPALGRGLLELPAGFGFRDTPAFALAVLLGIIATPMMARRLLGGWPPSRLMGRASVPARQALLAGLVVAAALTLWSRLLMWVSPEILMPAWRSFGITQPAEMWAAVLYVTPLTAALPEEIFFRGYAQGSLVVRLGRPWALLVMAVAFSLAHSGQGLAAVLLAIFPAALALGILYDRTGSILAPLTAHIVVNALAFLQMGSATFYPHWAGTIITAVTVSCLVLLLAARRHLVPALAGSRFLLAGLVKDRTGLGLALTTVPVAFVTVVVSLGLVGPLAGGRSTSPAPLLAAAGLLWTAALVLHHRRGAPWGADRVVRSDPEEPAEDPFQPL